MDEQEIDDLGSFAVTRKDVEGNEKVYVTFEDEKSCDYINKKAALCKNSNIKTFPFIPPQFFKHFSDLSKLTYIARKEDARLKTSILLGDDDLILKMKLKNETEWEREKDLNCFGEIAEMDMTIKWPSVDVKQISLPPKGRVRKNVHNLSQSGSESGSPEAKRSRIQEENLQKVQDFVKKLEARKPKFTQSKINFPKSKSSC